MDDKADRTTVPSQPVSDAQTAGREENVGVVVIHGVGEAEVGWINDYIIAELQKREPAMGLDPYSMVYRLPDKGRTKPGAMFRTIVRRANIAGRVNVLFSELHWADLSRVGQGAVMRTVTLLQLFFEAPHVLGTSFLNQSSSGIHGWIRWLILAALWLLRWPIAGMSLSLFASALGLMLMQRIDPNLFGLKLPYAVMGLLCLTACIGYTFARWRVNRDIALTDLGLSTTLFSSLMLGSVVLANMFLAPEIMNSHAVYLAFAGNAIIYLWIIWNFTTIGSILLMGLIWIKRKLTTSRHTLIPLNRPANALALAIVQGTIWKLIICPVSLAIIYGLAKGVEGGICEPPNLMEQSTLVWADHTVKIIAVKMVLVSVLNLGMTLLAFAAVGMVAAQRRIAVAKYGPTADIAGLRIPRMIVNPAISLSLFLGLILNVYTYYFHLDDDVAFCGIRDWLANAHHAPASLSWIFGVGCTIGAEACLTHLNTITRSTVIITVLPYFLSAIQKASTGVIHVARDIVDHQFTSRFEVARRLLPGARPRGTYPRRNRIQGRLDALIEGIIQTVPIDRLLFVTHSQGTVIMHDYLRSLRDDCALSHVKRIDVVTLASPLTHIYQNYFRAYEVQTTTAHALNPKLASWTNLWRIDDPIGNKVEILHDDFIRNERLPPGGHVNYWREDSVCRVILDLIDPTPKAEAERAAAARAEAEREAARPRTKVAFKA